MQARIDGLLRRRWESHQSDHNVAESIRYLIPESSPEGRERLLQALQQRIDWLSAHMPAATPPTMEWAKLFQWHEALRSIRAHLIRSGAGIEQEQLLTLLRQGNHAAFDRVAEHVAKKGYEPPIVEAVRKYHETLHGSVSDQARRQHVGWWLWLEDVTPIKSDECWSGVIRSDLRTFTGERAKAWRQLIGNMTFAVGNKMPGKWAKASAVALAAVGQADFRDSIRHWFTPLRDETPLRLTTPGRDVMRCLIWDCGLCPPDPQIDEALSWIGQAQWKNKESRDRMLKIMGPLKNVLGERDPQRASEIDDPGPPKPPPAPDPSSAMKKAMTQMLKMMPGGDRIEIHADRIEVRGELDQYTIDRDGVVTRRSGRKARVNIDALPNNISQLVRPAVDTFDLAHGPFQPNPMRQFSLAYILANDSRFGDAIE